MMTPVIPPSRAARHDEDAKPQETSRARSAPARHHRIKHIAEYRFHRYL